MPSHSQHNHGERFSEHPSDIGAGLETSVCEFCGKVFQNVNYLLFHISRFHQEQMKDQLKKADTRRRQIHPTTKSTNITVPRTPPRDPSPPRGGSTSLLFNDLPLHSTRTPPREWSSASASVSPPDETPAVQLRREVSPFDTNEFAQTPIPRRAVLVPEPPVAEHGAGVQRLQAPARRQRRKKKRRSAHESRLPQPLATPPQLSPDINEILTSLARCVRAQPTTTPPPDEPRAGMSNAQTPRAGTLEGGGADAGVQAAEGRFTPLLSMAIALAPEPRPELLIDDAPEAAGAAPDGSASVSRARSWIGSIVHPPPAYKATPPRPVPSAQGGTEMPYMLLFSAIGAHSVDVHIVSGLLGTGARARFEVVRRCAGDEPELVWKGAAGAFTDDGLRPATEYEYVLRAATLGAVDDSAACGYVVTRRED